MRRHRPANRSLMIVSLTALPGDITIERLTRAFAERARRSGQLHQDVTVPLEDTNRLRRLLEDNPIAAWSGGKGTGDVPYFAYDNGVFRFAVSVPPEQREAFQELVREIIEWRVAEYLERSGGSTARPDAQMSTAYK